jgi:hypothetical protein
VSTISSILNDTKKSLGLEDEYTPFDPEITMHINSVLAILCQLGIGPVDGFAIEDADAEWDDFLADVKPLNHVKTYMYLRVRYLFDPPSTSFALSAMNEQIKEFEWRINIYRETQLVPEEEIVEVTP